MKLSELPRKILNRLTMLLFATILPLERMLFRYSLVGHTELLDASRFPWTRELEENWRLIQAELDEVLRTRDSSPNYIDLSDEAAGLTERDNWKSFFFHAYGVAVPDNCARCPDTARLLQRIEGMKSGFFSIMLPGTHLKPHRGHFAGVLRYHLGLRIPDVEKCGIRVGPHTVHWEEGKSLIFDDTFEHEAWNHTDGIRVVLFVDFARPLPQPLAAINHAMIWLVSRSAVVQPGIARLAAWNRKLAERWPARGS
jgi:beta-hydroxylase